ncbi:hypothetical protein Pmani_024377 [Petrolisthes manimaculis]|uniref:Sulfatase N-terminal domain-containing protein n=1 Tax=Petrolisthes manimaculis TaxID=1843537 RepID=A0AAE1TYR0_9EUCA|nr:hypothetical protein Pmani_024377 [Petrolisthes manimaculis]
MKVLVWMLVLVLVVVGVVSSEGVDAPPNVLVLLADDLGIGDLGCYGNTTINTPNIDRLASEGVRLTHHLVASAMCTPSRAALFTSRYPTRYGLEENATIQIPVVLHTTSHVGLPADEVTLATALRAADYTTALVGKWHLGMNCSFLGRSCPGPLNHGFQSFYGIPTTLYQEFAAPGAFWRFSFTHPKFQALCVSWVAVVWSLVMGYRKDILSATCVFNLLLLIHVAVLAPIWFTLAHSSFDPFVHEALGISPWLHARVNSHIFRDEALVERPIRLEGLTHQLVDESRAFLTAHAHDHKPFFLVHSFAHVHVPMFSSQHMKGHSRHGRYGDNVEELDEGVGAILDTLRELGLEKNTLVYFTSDHGGHLEAVEPGTMERIGGHNGRFKGGKRQGGSEGGIRVPGLYRWPGILPTGVTVDVPTSLMDLMPTVLSLTGLPNITQLVPHSADKELDGVDISEVLLQKATMEGDGGKTTAGRRIFMHHCGQDIHALRLHSGEHVYKLYLYKARWHEGSTQCGWGAYKSCTCFDDVIDVRKEPQLYDLTRDPYEDNPPISPDTPEYQTVTKELLDYLHKWRTTTHLPPSQLSTMENVKWNMWYQP